MTIKPWRYRLARLLVGPLTVDRAWGDQVRCSWCVHHDFACGGDVHAVANAAMRDVIGRNPMQAKA
jgi:hypothetical protein